MDPNRRIMRSSTDRMIAGVCGGLANYLGFDATLVRIAFVLLTLAGVSPLIYIVLWVVMPIDTSPSVTWTQQVQQSLGEMQDKATTVVREVSAQVQNISKPNDASTPPPPSTDSGEQGPSTGPTRRL